MERELLLQPIILVMSGEFLASNEVKCQCHPPINCTAAIYVKIKFPKVRDTLLNCGLFPAGRRPLVANIDLSLKCCNSASRWAREVPKKGKSSEFNSRNYEQVKSSPSLKVWSHEGSILTPKIAQ